MIVFTLLNTPVTGRKSTIRKDVMRKKTIMICWLMTISLCACGETSTGSTVKETSVGSTVKETSAGSTVKETSAGSAATETEVSNIGESIGPPNESGEVMTVGEHDYPYYYNNMVEDYIEKVNEEFEAIGDNGFAFCFVTDQHIEHNAGYTPYIIKEIYDATPLKYVLNGGDFFNRDKTKEGGIAKLNECVSAFDFLEVPMFTTLGNHDLSENYNANDPDAYLTMEEFYETAMIQMEDVIYYDWDNGKYHYYYYDADSNTYLICIQTGGSITDSAPTSFLKEDAQALQNLLPTLDGNIIIFTHQLNKVNSEYSHNNSWKRLINAIDASGSKDKVKLIVSGHAHVDLSDDSDGVLHVVTTTNSFKTDPSWKGTTDELAFDTYFVDYENGTVKTLRFGRGEDRSFMFE